MTAHNVKGGLKRTFVDVTSNTLTTIRDAVLHHLNQGDAVECPCCKQLVKKYRYRITRTMAGQLLHLYRHGPTSYVDFENVVDEGKQHKGHYLAKWELITFDPETRKYELSEKGRSFIRGECTVPKYIEMYNQNVLQYSGPQVTFQTCLGQTFSLADVFATQGAQHEQRP